MFEKIKLYLLISIVILSITYDALPSSKTEETSPILLNIIDLYKKGRYADIVELSYNYSFKNMDEMLILAKSFENLGYYNRAYREYREIYNKYPSYKPHIYYFIANLFTKTDDFSEALKWYKVSIYGFIKSKDNNIRDWKIFSKKILDTIFGFYVDGKISDREITQVLKSLNNDFSPSFYYLSRLYFEKRSYKKAFYYAKKLLNSNAIKYYKIGLLKKIANNEITLELFLSDKSLHPVVLLKNYNMYYELLKVYNFFREKYGKESLYEREIGFDYYKIGDYKNALIIFNRLYHKNKDPELLINIAYSYYNLNRKKIAKKYLNQYLAIQKYKFKYSYRAYYLKVLYEIRNRDYQSVIDDMEYIIKKYAPLNNMDIFIYKLFYLLVGDDQLENAIRIVFLYYPYVKGDYYKSWTSYILGLYVDTRYFYESILSFPGGYYYFKSIKYIKIPQNKIKIADRQYNKGDYKNALKNYILLYASGYNKDYVRVKIENILEKGDKYKHIFSLKKFNTQNSFIFRLYTLGFFEDLKSIFLTVSESADISEKYFMYYILAKINYDENNYKQGLLYAEIMSNSLNYIIFLPSDLLSMLYPMMYENKIKEELVKYNWFTDECFVMSIIREESRYDERAMSNRGAVGLMQLLPDTASWIYHKKITRKKLLDPEFNIEVGVNFLNYLYRKFSDCCLILAAYNGGPTNVSKWIKKYGDGNIDRFIETIPYPETRNFIKKVFRSYSIYKETYPSLCNIK